MKTDFKQGNADARGQALLEFSISAMLLAMFVAGFIYILALIDARSHQKFITFMAARARSINDNATTSAQRWQHLLSQHSLQITITDETTAIYDNKALSRLLVSSTIRPYSLCTRPVASVFPQCDNVSSVTDEVIAHAWK